MCKKSRKDGERISNLNPLTDFPFSRRYKSLFYFLFLQAVVSFLETWVLYDPVTPVLHLTHQAPIIRPVLGLVEPENGINPQ